MADTEHSPASTGRAVARLDAPGCRVAGGHPGAVLYSAIGAYAVDGGSFLLAFAGAICVPAAGMFLARRLQA